MQEKLEPIFIEKSNASDDSNVNIGKVISQVVAYWPLFVIFVVLSILVAYVYLRYKTPEYRSHAKILVKDDKKGGSIGEGQILEELGVQTSAANVENEIEIIKSRTLMKKVVDAIDLNIHYYAPGRIKTSEYYYKELPFRLIPLFEDSLLSSAHKYNLNFTDDKTFTITKGERSWSGSLGEAIRLDIGDVLFQDKRLTANSAYTYNEYKVAIKPIEYEAIKALKNVDVDASSRKSSVVDLSYSDIIPSRGEDVLDELIRAYLNASIQDRNTTMTSTIEFIDNRLKGVIADLSDVEGDIESFKRERKLTDLSEQAKLLLDYSGEYNKKITEKEVELRVIESLEQYLRDEQNNERLLPSNLLVQDDAAMGAMESYNQLQLKRSSLLLTKTEENPFIKNIDKQLSEIRSDLIRSLSSMKEGVRAAIKELNSRTSDIDDEIRKVPGNERVFLEYSRQQNIKQELYLFLLKKREETAISKSSTVANARIVDPAKSDGGPYTPKRGRAYLAAFVIGLIIPSAYIFVKELLNVKVVDKNDVKRHTQMEIIGEIGHNNSADEIVVDKHAKTIVAEQFRTLRTNLQFLLAGDNEKVMLFTSSMSGEGKSFISLNTAVTLALSGSKVLLMELDLRKPKISAALQLENKDGFTKYVIGQSSKNDIIHTVNGVENLYILPAGAIPPNPSELILSKKVEELFDGLRQEYDYIIIDSAPVGLVTDAQLLSRYADTVLFVSRISYTYKEQLKYADELCRSKKMPLMHLVLNDVSSKSGAYGYGYGAYGNEDYYHNDKSGNTFVNIFRGRNNRI